MLPHTRKMTPLRAALMLVALSIGCAPGRSGPNVLIVVLDTTRLALPDVIERMVTLVRARTGA